MDIAEQTGILQLFLYQAMNNGNGGSLLFVCVISKYVQQINATGIL